MSNATDGIVEVIRKLASERQSFTSDDIRPLLPADADAMQIPSAVQRARREGLVREIGRKKSTIPERKGSLVPVFVAGVASSTPTQTPEKPAAGAGAGAGASLKPADLAGQVDALREFMDARGHLIGAEDLAALLVLSASRNWTVLAGPSGTGKSSVVRLLAEGLGARFADIQVKRNWTTSEEVLGYYAEMAGVWVDGPLRSQLVEADERDELVVVRFDEMNLASPEYYAAELLSAGEAWTGKGAAARSAPVAMSPAPVGVAPPSPRLSNNVLLFGTVNLDETTQPLSPKVLDRSVVFSFDNVDLASLPVVLDSNRPAPAVPELISLFRERPRTIGMIEGLDVALVAEVADLLGELDTYTAAIGSPIGYRPRDGMVIALTIWSQGFQGLISRDALIDQAIRAMVLPKLQGSSGALGLPLRGLASVLSGMPDVVGLELDEFDTRLGAARYPMSFAKVAQMLRRLEAFGYFDYW